MDTGKPNRPIEKAAGFIGAFLTGTWFLHSIALVADWIGRGQTLMALDPYIHYVVTPWAFLVQFVGAVGLLFYATRLEHFREADETPRIIIDLSSRRPQKPKRHWLWIKVGIGSVFVSVLVYAAIFGILHHHSRTGINRATNEKSADSSTSTNTKQSAKLGRMPSSGYQDAKKRSAHPLVLPSSNAPVRSSSISATPMPEHASPYPAIPPTASPYDELQAVETQVEKLNTEWKHDIEDAGSRSLARNRVNNKLPMPTQLPDELADALSVDNLRATYDYENKLLPTIKKARDDANAYMQTTHTDQVDDDQSFTQANQQALKAASPSSLRRFSPYPDQFESITNYLAKLLRKLGTYPNTSKPLTR